jgi:acetylornithine deacetylase/succinyl-diaminopimelate desuccinylase-like protein
MEELFQYVEDHSERFISELNTLVKQPSISAHGIGIKACAELLVSMMENVGIDSKILPMGGKNNAPLVFGEALSDHADKTVLIYGHFDVQPPGLDEEWDSLPFEPTIRDGRVYGRGTADSKGQLFAHIKAVEAIRKVKGELPVNLKFIFDPEEEIGSPSLDDFIRDHAELLQADFSFYSDGPIHPSGRPKLNFGCRGTCCVEVSCQEANRDLHSGQFGGPIPNPNWRMFDFLNTLRDSSGRILIEGFYDHIISPTPSEMAAMQAIPFDAEGTRQELGLERFAEPDDQGFWERIMFHPTLNICGYTSGYGGEGMKTIIPCKAMTKIDMRLIKNQTPEDIYMKFQQHMEKHGFNDFEIKLLGAYTPSKTSIEHSVSKAFISAAQIGFGKEPVIFPVTGGSLPLNGIRDFLKIPMVGVPYANHDSRNHAPNENMIIDLFIKGIKTSTALFYEINYC